MSTCRRSCRRTSRRTCRSVDVLTCRRVDTCPSPFPAQVRWKRFSFIFKTRRHVSRQGVVSRTTKQGDAKSIVRVGGGALKMPVKLGRVTARFTYDTGAMITTVGIGIAKRWHLLDPAGTATRAFTTGNVTTANGQEVATKIFKSTPLVVSAAGRDFAIRTAVHVMAGGMALTTTPLALPLSVLSCRLAGWQDGGTCGAQRLVRASRRDRRPQATDGVSISNTCALALSAICSSLRAACDPFISTREGQPQQALLPSLRAPPHGAWRGGLRAPRRAARGRRPPPRLGRARGTPRRACRSAGPQTRRPARAPRRTGTTALRQASVGARGQ